MKKKKKNLPYTTQTFTVPFYQSKKISRLIWAARSQIDWCYNEGVRQVLEDGQQGRFGLYGILTEKRAEHGWLDINSNIHRYAADCGRKAVEAFRESNIVKRGMPKHKRKYTPPDSLFRKKKKNSNGSQPAIGCYGHPAGRADGSWNLGGICNIVPKDASMERDQIRSFQIIETTKKTTCHTRPENRTYELHVQMHVAKPERSNDGDIIGADVGAVNMLAIHNLDKNATVLATLPENATRHKNDDIDRRKSEQSRRKKGGNTWKKEQRRIAKAVQKVRNRRTDFMRKTVKEGFADAGTMGVENLHPKQMARKGRGKTGLNRVIKYAALGEVLSYIEWFAEKHNKEFHKVKPYYTSITCGACGHSDRNSRRSQSEFVCVRCGHEDHADSNAGVNIAQRCAEAAGHVVIRRKEHTVPRTTKRGGAMQERTNQNASLPSEKNKNGHESPPVAGVYYCI